MTLPGPSRTIVVEPLRAPVHEPRPAEPATAPAAPEPATAPPEPDRAPAEEPARTRA